MKKSVHWFYVALLGFSMIIVAISFSIVSKEWNTIVLSVGCGGIASVAVAWLIDCQNHRNKKEENKTKYEMILQQYVKLYRRMLFVAQNECRSICSDKEERTFQEWLSLLTAESSYAHVGLDVRQRKCIRLSGTLIAMQEYIERLQVQSATLIINDLPNIKETLEFMDVQYVHIGGTLSRLEGENYKGFCDTTVILYNEFLDNFPEYKDQFPEYYWDINI